MKAVKILTPEKRPAICYAFIKEKNKKWLAAQAKEHGIKMSPMLDCFIDVLRAEYKKKSA